MSTPIPATAGTRGPSDPDLAGAHRRLILSHSLAGCRFQRMFPPWPERDQGRSEAQGITAANPAELDELVPD